MSLPLPPLFVDVSNCLGNAPAKFWKCLGLYFEIVLGMISNMFGKRVGMGLKVFASIPVRWVVPYPAKSFLGAIRAPLPIVLCERL